ncbi:hypothetical protein QUA42_26940 [Microcoleus sp. Pol11C2]
MCKSPKRGNIRCKKERGRPLVSASSGRSDSLLCAIEHPTVGDRAHVEKN